MKKFLCPLMVFVLLASASVSAQAAGSSQAASPATAKVLVDGRNVAFGAYTINDSNYFKLRDLAYSLSGTGKQFDVGWDSGNNAVSLTSGKPYTVAGGEMAGISGGAQTAVPTDSKVYFDGKEVFFTAYNIGGNNYFKLRDIGSTIDFGIGWDETERIITIDTSIGYSEAGSNGNGGYISATSAIGAEGLNVYWEHGNLQFAADPNARLVLYTSAENDSSGGFLFDDGNTWLLAMETSFGKYALLPKTHVQLGSIHCSAFIDDGNEFHVLVTVVQSAGYRIYDCVFDASAKIFQVKPVYEEAGINLIISGR